MKKTLIFLLLISLTIAAVFAGDFVIEGYTFNISGKTKEGAVKNLVVPSGEERFATRDDMVASLDGKVQTLDNLRVFKNVTYLLVEEEKDGDTYVHVTFIIEDAKTFLIIPYPKYDTNVGMILGVKIYETNVLGNFADFTSTIRAIFPAESFGSPYFDGKFALSGLKIGKVSISTDFIGYSDSKNFTYNLSASSIPLFSSLSLNASTTIKRTSGVGEYTFSTSMGNLHLWDIALNPSLTLYFHDNKTSSYITPSLGTSNIRLGHVNLSFSDYVKFTNQKQDDESYQYKAYEMAHTTSLSFSESALSPFSVSNTLKYTPKSAYEINTTLYHVLSPASTVQFIENIKLLEDGSTHRYDTGVGLSQQMYIGEHISLRPTLSEFMRIEKDMATGDLAFSRYYIITGSTSGNYIDWKGNFRDGISYSISISESWIQDYLEKRSVNADVGVNDHIELVWHKILWSWLNPSFRFTLNYTSNTSDYGSIKGGSGFAFGEYLRGVRNATTENYDQNMLSAVANFNIMSKFPLPSFLSFVDAYINFFFDYGIAKPKVGIDARNFYGFGVEGIGIFKNYPSYPIRASLGFDLEKLIKKINKEDGGSGFYEIYIGLGFFF